MAVLSSSTESPTFHFRRLKFLSLCIFTLSLLKNPPGAHGKLTIEKECGDIVCESHYYCSKMDHSCRPCQLTCDPALGNFDKSVCERDCQGTMKYRLFMKMDHSENIQKLKNKCFCRLPT
jgi:hypothetical protein